MKNPITLVLTLGAALGCKGTASPSTAFGVNITVDAKALSAAQLLKASIGSLQVTGAETEVKEFSIAGSGAITTGELRFRFIPKVETGMLKFHFDALDSYGALFGSGDSGEVTLTAGAVSATITLTASNGAKMGDGVKCTVASECGSGFCTDGVCCNELCNDTCVSCALASSTGVCVPYDAGTDPERECTGNIATGSDGGAQTGTDAAATHNADAGDAAVAINVPEAGIVETPNTCGGTCSGMRACGFAAQGMSCGDPFCNTRKDLANLKCDGLGSCGIDLSACADGYACDFATGACRTSCNANLDCQATSYCNGSNEKCATQKADGITCATDAECTSGQCVTGVCCRTACAAPNTCNDSGSAGQCKCPNLTCAANVSCTTFYRDSDLDGYGDNTGAMGTTKVGCADTVPAGFVANNTDCDDNNVNVHPGQTAYFAVPRSNGTFDYDCDGTIEKELNEYPGASCAFCPTPTAGCKTASSASCSAAGTQQATFACTAELRAILTASSSDVGFSASPGALTIGPPIGGLLTCCGCFDASGFVANIACGASAAYYTCGTCSGTKATATTSVLKQQLCH